MKKRHTDEQIIRILREAESHQEPVKDLCKRHKITEQTFYRWRNKFGGMDVPEARRLKELESENDRLKRLIAEQLLVIDGLKEFSRKNDNPDGPARSAGSPDPTGAVATQGMSLPGIESTGAGLHPQTADERSSAGRATHCGLSGGASLWISPYCDLAIVERVARTPDVEGLETERPEASPAQTAQWQRYSLTRRDPAQFGLELRLRSRPIGGRARLEAAARDRRIHTGMPGDPGWRKLAFARRDSGAVQVDAALWKANVCSIG